MRLVQILRRDGSRAVGIAESARALRLVAGETSTRELGLQAYHTHRSIEELVRGQLSDEVEDYDCASRELRILPPVDHPDPAHLLISLTGLTHLGSAQPRDDMHADGNGHDGPTDTMKMFKLGLRGGRPEPGRVGAQPEWAYKGDGSTLVPPGRPIELPDYAEDGGEEAEVAGLYVVADDGTPLRLGFAIGNEYSDHVLEKRNYLYLAHSKLRQCSLAPEMLLGELPADFSGDIEISRDDRIVWSGRFRSGSERMCHSIANLEHHHFKYSQFRRPGDVHVHFFGASLLSYSSGLVIRPGDSIRIAAREFGRPLVNPIVSKAQTAPVRVRVL